MSRAKGRLLIVEDNDPLRKSIQRALEARFATTRALSRGDDAIALLQDPGAEPFSVVVTDLRLPGADGSAVLRAAREAAPEAAVLLMTAFGSIETAVAAMREGAFDFLQKPFELGELEARVEKAMEHAELRGSVGELRQQRSLRYSADHIVGRSDSFRSAVRTALRVAPMRSTVLLTGETGTGKELVAGMIHEASPRAGGPFVKVNCAALPETLLESELFGHERGAFTSADRLRIGRFEQADGGTLFLDEIGDISLTTQAKLLRVLQDQTFQRLGGVQALQTDARIVAATNRDLRRAIADGAFREDLFFRLDVLAISLPPLRERLPDIEPLARHFLEVFSRELGRKDAAFAPAALEALRDHAWPGNVRELRNVIERAVLMSEHERIERADLRLERRALAEGWRPNLPPAGLSLDAIQRAVVEEALERCAWVQKDAAALLGISRRKLNYMIQQMGVTHPSWRRNRAVGSGSIR